MGGVLLIILVLSGKDGMLFCCLLLMCVALSLSLLKKSPASFGFQSSKFYLHSTAETEELKQKRINGSYQDLSKLTAETEFRGNGNRINRGESVVR